jgi:serine phosphatase RsbU (regulator of sigma subunit)
MSMHIDSAFAALFILTLLCIVAAAFAIRVISWTLGEGRAARDQADSLAKGDFVSSQRKKFFQTLGRRPMGLRIKYVVFAAMLALFAAMVAALPLYYRFTQVFDEATATSVAAVAATADEASRRLFVTTLILACAAAVVCCAAFAFIISAAITIPLKKLIRSVEQIRDTQNITTLGEDSVSLDSNDELSVLARSLSEMKRGLINSARAAYDLSIGKEIQKRFIPLDLDKNGNKLTTGLVDTPFARFFSYYEGAKGISGDYFNCQNLDGRFFALATCDVAGKGVPAALIMILVATLFTAFFKTWKNSDENMDISLLAYRINDFIESLGFEGRFAALMLCIFDSQTGLLRLCNAGDNIIRWYDGVEQRLKRAQLCESPATGVFPSTTVESRWSYKTQTMPLKSGDILLLYTDGIEESQRCFRSQSFDEIACNEGSSEQGKPHGNHVTGEKSEQMGWDRIEAIVNAVQSGGQYALSKYHNPEGAAALQFDFAGCDKSPDAVIMALVSVEKVFRFYKNTKAAATKVLADKKVDDFLKKHFLQYKTYCTWKEDDPTNSAYIYYLGLAEDEQYDDLTLLGVQKK